MESTNKNKQSKLTTFAFDTLIFILVLISVVGLLYSTYISDVEIPYKPATSLSDDPVLLAVNVSIFRLQNMSSLLENLISKSEDPVTLHSLKSCKFQQKIAGRQLNQLLDLLTEGPGDDDLLFTTTLDDWIRFAVLEHKMCLYFLQGLQVVDEMSLHTLKKFTNTNVAVLEKIWPLLEKSRPRICLFNHLFDLLLLRLVVNL